MQVNDYLAQLATYAEQQAQAQAQYLIEMRRSQERLRGVKSVRQKFLIPSVPITFSIEGPTPGWAWSLMSVTVTLTGADSVAIYAGDGLGGDAASTSAPIGYIPPVSAAAPAQPIGQASWAKGAAVIFNGEGLFLATSGAFRFTQVTLSAIQVPAEEIGKMLT